jgi:hypothetical protein
MSWPRTFHGREHFMGANILICADILHASKYFGYAQIFQDVRIYFDWKRIFYVYIIIFSQAPIFNDFCSNFCPVLFSQ